ncbi:MAG: exodeoxyribonuclease VII large subunit [Candidatus Omnitrophica bacterium]|nr:exodeoxyribonuclease VII large subunit [Candidatus Omnitrophota bacterium]
MDTIYDHNDSSIAGKKKVFKVSEITQLVKNTLEASFDGVWVEGEVSNFSAPISGHHYLTLKDANAQLRVVMFKYANQHLRFKIENGMQILFFGKITVYPQRGEYQLVATRAEPKGVGALQLAFEQLKKKLSQEGLFALEHKKELPLLPQRIGVVTSITGAAFRDILHVLHRRFANLAIVIVPVQVQGDAAAADIARAIELFNEYNKVDVLIVGRGGGSIEDLWAFNEEIVARAIYASEIPVISAVGHEIDYTISDFVADLRAPTPSAAAEMVIGSKDHLEERIDVLNGALKQLVEHVLRRSKERAQALQSSYFFKNPRAIIENYTITLDNLAQTLVSSLRNRVRETQLHFQGVCQHLTALNPLAVLARGYSVTTDETGGVIRSIKKVKGEDIICTRLQDGIIHSRVMQTKRQA